MTRETVDLLTPLNLAISLMVKLVSDLLIINLRNEYQLNHSNID